MPTLIQASPFIAASGNRTRIIEEYIGWLNSATSAVSVARIRSFGSWN